MSAQIDRLEKKIDNAVSGTGGTRRGGNDSAAPGGGSGGTKGGGSDARRCFKCNAVGHISRDCPSPKELDPMHTPPNTKKGDSRERVRNGTTERWCGRCREGKGIWTKGADLHYTEDHPKTPASSSPPVAVAAVAAAEANLGFIEAPFHFGFLGFIGSSPSASCAFVDGVDFSSTPDHLSPDATYGADADDDDAVADPVILVHPKGPGGKVAA